MQQTCFMGSNLQGGAHFPHFTIQAPNKMSVYPHANLVSAQALIYLFSCLSVPVISFLAACDQFPHHAMMVSKVKLAALRIILHLMPHLKKQ